MSELDNFGTAGAKSASSGDRAFLPVRLTYIILTKTFCRSIGRCLFNATRPPVTTSEVFLLSSSCDKHYKAVIST
ncbi:hypothetical protein QUB63_33020 [Microcoleus sp. ARI1-B5]|uniref:hypothetical protein n=1 Tax=unclassified Microcoleus TaxID=2642155 RepID=UPI002FD31BA7